MADYICREDAIKELREVYEQEYPTASGDFDEYANHDVPNVLRNIPTADVQPVRYGQWIWDGNKEECICSECGKGNLKYSTVFCPDCGARMDLKDGVSNE